MLEAINVGYAIDGTWIVRGLIAALRPGRVMPLVGPNGAGKTTALRLMAGLIPMAEGQIRLDGRPIESIARGELARYGYLRPPEAAARRRIHRS